MYPLIPITDTIFIPTYLLTISLTYCVGIFWIIKRANQFQLDKQMALDLCLTIMLGGFLGARLLHIIYEEPQYYLNDPINIFKVWQGGFVFYGGAFLAFFLSFWLIKMRKESFGKWADLFAPVIAGGYAIGRIACFLNGCCYGKACALPWAVTFPHTHVHGNTPLHPTQLYAFSWEATVLILLLVLEKRKFLKNAGTLFFLWLGFHGIGRLIMEAFRDDERGQFIFSLSISSWLSLILIAGAIIGHLRSQPPNR